MNKSSLDPTQLEAINQAMQSTFPEAEWHLVGQLGGGLSPSSLYKIAIAERFYVVRCSVATHPHRKLTQEYAIMRLAAAQKLAPQIHFTDPQTGIALMDFVEGQPFIRSGEDGPVFLRLLARLVRTLHNGQKFPTDTALTDKVEFLFVQMRPDIANTALVQQGMEKMRQLAPFLHNALDQRPSHCDFNPGNILFDGKQLWLVDWEAAAQENFYFDLACCCNFFFYQSAQAEDAFLQAYFERPLSEEEQANYARMRTFVKIYYGVIFAYLGTPADTPLLSQTEIDVLPTYPQFLSLIGQDKEQLANPLSRQRLGFIYLKSV